MSTVDRDAQGMPSFVEPTAPEQDPPD